MFRADKKPTLSITELTGNPITFKSRFANMPLADCKVSIPIMQEGSGTPSPTNVRNFIGVSQAVISRTGKNLYYSADIRNGIRREARDVFLPIGTYTLSANVSSSDTDSDYCLIYDDTNAVILGLIERGSGKSITITTDKPIYQIRFFASDGYSQSQDDTFSFANIQIERGSDATTYEPYTGNTYTISFGQTVYSAILDVLTGKLSITHKIVDLGDLEWDLVSGATRFYTDDITDISLEADFTDMFCSGYNVISSAVSFPNMPDKSIKRGQSNANISIRDLDYTDKDLFTASVTGMKLVYELATPIEVILDGHTIEAVKGVNNIFANIGTTTVSYVEVK